jgi:trehalose 6-phosphate phosphatase
MAQANFYDLIGFAPRHTEPRSGAPDAPDLGRAALFLDFDGTLVDIAPRPDGITVPEDLGPLLAALHARTAGRTVIVSGRRMADLDRFLPDFPGVRIGSHGAEVFEEGRLWQHEAVESDALACIRRMAAAWAEDRAGVLVEDKPCSVVLHFRQAPDAMAPADRFLTALVQDNPGFALHHAKMALEVHPADVSKRGAIAGLIARWQGALPVAFGDDATDEGMFEAVNAAGGLSIKVGGEETAADWRLDRPEEVRAALRTWLAAPGAS